MRALVCSGIADALQNLAISDCPVPLPAASQVQLKVSAASVNYPDILMCQGRYQHRPDMPFIPGMNVAGEVTAVGAAVTGFQLGERVAGSAKTGGFAEFAVIDSDQLRHIPAAVSMPVAAAFPSAYLTAYVALVRRGNLQPGETLLVHGASGGVGLAAVDLGRILGARVIATSGQAEKRQILTAYGADHCLDANAPFAAEVKALTDGRGADVIFDSIGGDVFDQSTRCIAFDGRLLVIGFMAGRFATLATNIALIKGFSVVGVRAGEYGRQFPARGQENLDAIWTLAANGQVKPRIHAELPLADAAAAMQMLADRQVVGKVVVRCDR